MEKYWWKQWFKRGGKENSEVYRGSIIFGDGKMRKQGKRIWDCV